MIVCSEENESIDTSRTFMEAYNLLTAGDGDLPYEVVVRFSSKSKFTCKIESH